MVGDDLLPCGMKECTKRGIVLQHSDYGTSIYKANLQNYEANGQLFYYICIQNHIVNGFDNVKKVLTGLNENFPEDEKDTFYLVKTPIKFFNDIKLDNAIKSNIYLLDFPGYGTGNLFETQTFSKVMSICDAFIFVVRNSIIKENANAKVLDQIFQQAMEQRGVLSSKFIKQSIFIINYEGKKEEKKLKI